MDWGRDLLSSAGCHFRFVVIYVCRSRGVLEFSGFYRGGNTFFSISFALNEALIAAQYLPRQYEVHCVLERPATGPEQHNDIIIIIDFPAIIDKARQSSLTIDLAIAKLFFLSVITIPSSVAGVRGFYLIVLFFGRTLPLL